MDNFRFLGTAYSGTFWMVISVISVTYEYLAIFRCSVQFIEAATGECAKLRASRVFVPNVPDVPYVPYVPTCYTSSCTLCACVALLLTCLPFLRVLHALIFYFPYLPSCFYVPYVLSFF